MSSGGLLLTAFCLLVRLSPISSECKALQFECDNGSCISRYDVCDGVQNCPDGSDETAATCVSQRQGCSKPYFQCSYGGCVSGTAACNGVKDCADGSDETVLRCGNEDDIRQFNHKGRGNCRENEIKCPNGICIDKSTTTCDGKDDCGDGSGYDESVELCGHIECPGYSFKCGTGGCIPGSLSCDGKNDCFDGSDESPLLCNTTRIASTTPPIVVDQAGCPLPFEDERPIVKDLSGRLLIPPINRATVKFYCESGYTLEGHETSHCANRKWSVPPPKCVKYCDSRNKFDGYSTKATCTKDGQRVDCNKRYHPPGTEVKFDCATGFRSLVKTTLPDMKCMKGGYWNRDREKCEQECGEIATPTKSFSAFGYSVNNTVVPWHVGIYASHNEKELEYTFICGGSLLTPDLVITAAHCVFSEPAKRVYSPNTFVVIAAKFYRSYKNVSAEERKIGVQQIIIPKYEGSANNFYNDLALIILENPFEFNNIIRPICVSFSANAEKETVNNDVQGKFAGWNIDAERELQFVPAISKMYSVCKDNIPDIRSDKFCIFTQGKSLACQGDSGGGFTAQRQNRHYLYGVISNAPNAGQCAHSLTVLTNIQHFETEISKEIENSINGRS